MDIEDSFAKISVCFNDPEGGEIIVYRHCPDCGKFIKTGKLFTNILGNVKLEGWICKKDGEVNPFYERF
jgi:hypothetical protein